MVRILTQNPVDANVTYFEFAGKVGDTKPTGKFAQCSSYMELDVTNQKIKPYFWDEDSESWIEVGG